MPDRVCKGLFLYNVGGGLDFIRYRVSHVSLIVGIGGWRSEVNTYQFTWFLCLRVLNGMGFRVVSAHLESSSFGASPMGVGLYLEA